MITVLFNTYPVAFDCPGGGEIQLLKCKEALENLGVRVLLYDPWAPQFDEADIVHFFSVQGGSVLFLRHVAESRKQPLVISPILWLGEEKDSYPLGEIGYYLAMCDRALPNSQAEADLFCEHYSMSQDKFTPITNGIDPIFSEPAAPQIFLNHYGIDSPFILNLANVEHRKNQLNLIRALKGTGLKLKIVGNIRDQDYFNQCMSEGEGFVEFLGYLEHGSELHRSAYAACDLFALPSTLETPGLAALEAGAAGSRIAVTEEGCTREYFRDHATYLDHRAPEKILEGILKALKTPPSTKLSRHILKNHTWAVAGKQLLQVYEDVLKSKQG